MDDDRDKAMYFDRQGVEIGPSEYAEFHQDVNYKILKKTQVLNKEVSTVWLGTDYGISFGDEQHAPIIFETMIFSGDMNEEAVWRYSTEEEAFEGHEHACQWVYPAYTNASGEWKHVGFDVELPSAKLS